MKKFVLCLATILIHANVAVSDETKTWQPSQWVNNDGGDILEPDGIPNIAAEELRLQLEECNEISQTSDRKWQEEKATLESRIRYLENNTKYKDIEISLLIAESLRFSEQNFLLETQLAEAQIPISNCSSCEEKLRDTLVKLNETVAELMTTKEIMMKLIQATTLKLDQLQSKGRHCIRYKIKRI